MFAIVVLRMYFCFSMVTLFSKNCWDRYGYSHKIIGVFVTICYDKGAPYFLIIIRLFADYMSSLVFFLSGIRTKFLLHKRLERGLSVWERKGGSEKRNNFVFRAYNQYSGIYYIIEIHTKESIQFHSFIHKLFERGISPSLIKNGSVTSYFEFRGVLGKEKFG